MSEKKEYTGFDKHPGLIAIVVTIVIGVIFIGGLYLNSQGGHEGGEHTAPDAEHAAEAAPAGEAAH